LRFHGAPGTLAGEVLPELERCAAELHATGDVWRLQLDTYDREVERYGGPQAVELAERIFEADSDAALELLSMLEDGEAGEAERWKLALLGADALLDALGLTFDGKRDLATRLKQTFAEEHHADAALSRALGELYRKHARELGALLGDEPGARAASAFAPGFEVLARRAEEIAPLAAGLRRLESEGRVSRPLGMIVPSLVHMSVNRLLTCAHRRQELVLYDLLARTYASVAGRRADARRD
jgi:thiopeptide-type bacteriocin biosynthesis protein